MHSDQAKKIRSLDAKKFIGKTVSLKLQHISDDKKSQYVRIDGKCFNDNDLHGADGWIKQVLGKPETVLKRKIKEFYLLESMNGGRGDSTKYTSYKKYFTTRKKDILSSWGAGLLGKLMGRGGDPDRCDIIVVLNDGLTIEDHCVFSIEAPEEWYGELHGSNSKFKFADGFYESADKAIEIYKNKDHQDIFGERCFLVLVFPFKTKADVRNIVWQAKTHSKFIKLGDLLIVGTRCKPDEYGGVIMDTYENGGKVPIGVEWDWD